MSQSQAPDVGQLLQAAAADGDITKRTATLLANIDMGAQIQAGLGMNALDVPASEATLVFQEIDDSGSIRFASNAQHVRDGHNTMLEALAGSKQKSGVLVSTRYLNGTLLFPFVPLDQAVQLDDHNYNPTGGTPLYDMTLASLGTLVAKRKEFEDAGIVARCVMVIVSDGADEHSPKVRGGHGTTAADCRELVTKLLQTEQYIIAAIGIDDGGRTDFKRVFSEMGIRDEWILTPANTQHDIRQAFALVSQSAVRASQSAGSFSQVALGGFGNP